MNSFLFVYLPSVNPFQWHVYPCPFLLFNIYFIYLAALGLLCGMGMRDLSCSVQDQFPDQELNLASLHWEQGVLATGPLDLLCLFSDWTVFPFLNWWVLRVLYVFQKQVLCQIQGLQLYSQSIVCLFILFARSFQEQNFLILMRFNEWFFHFMDYTFGVK